MVFFLFVLLNMRITILRCNLCWNESQTKAKQKPNEAKSSRFKPFCPFACVSLFSFSHRGFIIILYVRHMTRTKAVSCKSQNGYERNFANYIHANVNGIFSEIYVFMIRMIITGQFSHSLLLIFYLFYCVLRAFLLAIFFAAAIYFELFRVYLNT